MSEKIRGITVEIGGDTTGLTKALKGVNSEIKSTQSQLKDVEKLLKLDPKNTELLRQKQKLLKDAIAETKTKLDTLNKAEKAMKDNGVDKNSEQFLALRREIINTEQNMASLEKEATATSKQIKAGGKTAEQAKEDWAKFGDAVGKGAKALASATAAAAAAGAAVGAALTTMTRDTAKYADTINTQAQITGVSAEKLQEYAYAAELVDVSVDTITGAMQRNIRAMAAAENGTEAYVEAYDALGISVLDANGNLRDSEEVFWETIEALGSIENETERDAIAMQLLGRSAQDLNPLIKIGAERFEELGQEAQAAGYILGDEALAEFGAFDDQMQRLDAGATAAKRALGTVLLPVLTDLATEGVDLLAEFTNGITAADGDITQMAKVIEDILPRILEAVGQYLPALVSLVGSVVEALAKTILDNLPEIITAVIEVILNIANALIDHLDEIVAAALQIVLALAQGLIDALPKLIPAVIDAVLMIVETLTEPDNLGMLIQAGILIALAVIQGVAKAMPRLIEAALNIVQNLKEVFASVDWAGIWDGVVDAAKDVWAGIKSVFSQVGKFFGDVFSAAWQKVVKVFSVAGNIFVDIKDGIVSAFKKIVNGLISGINKVISKPFEAINNALSKIKDINILGAQPFKNLQTVSIPQIPMLARGGVVSSGSAIVGEAGAELLTVANGRAYVQPLTNNTISAPLTINVYGAAGQDVSLLADEVADRIQTFIDRKEAAYA